ncbi:MAG: tetratricopeptide repeat protein [Pirellulales bacterium]|nr:tetratricopeptide repeat protein [Pirellulales bacterium]
MPHVSRGISLVLLLALLPSGCRLPGRDGPVPQALADCRRLSRRGVAALERGQQQTAENLLAQAVTACPFDAEARRHYAESLWMRDARGDAIAQMEEAVRLAEEEAAFAVRLAEMYLADGQAKLARRGAERAVELDPTMSRAWATRGGAMRSLGQPREALNDYHRALGLAPDDRDILLTVAELHLQLDRPRRALQTLQGLAETYPPGEEPSQVLSLLGRAYVAVGRYEDGAESLAAAAARGRPTAELYCRLGEAHLQAGRLDEAAAAVQQALAMQPDCPPGRELLQRIAVARRGKDWL